MSRRRLGLARAVPGSSSKPTRVGLARTGTGGLVTETVSAALFLFQELGDEPEAALIAAANAGGDTDTVGAVLGNLVGAWNGYAALPARWSSRVQAGGALLAEAARLCALRV